jgi:hypothetical protein
MHIPEFLVMFVCHQGHPYLKEKPQAKSQGQSYHERNAETEGRGDETVVSHSAG